MRPSALIPWLALLLTAPAIARTAPHHHVHPVRPVTAHAPPHRLAVVCWDGAGQQLVERMMAEGAMPNLTRMKNEGASASQVMPGFGSADAAARAALWTGTLAVRNGVEAAWQRPLPPADHTILESREAQGADTLDAEPVFATLARAGRRVVTLDLPYTSPFSAFASGGRFGAGTGDRLAINDTGSALPGASGEVWDGQLTPARGWRELPTSATVPLELSGVAAGQTFYALAFDDAADPRQGYDTVWLVTDKAARVPLAVLKPAALGTPGAWSRALAVHTPAGLASLRFRLFDLAPDGHRLLLYQGPASVITTNQPAHLPAFYQAGGGPADLGAGAAYARGAFGATLAEGGEGLAEARYMDAFGEALATARRNARAALTDRAWDLFAQRLPFPGEPLSMWAGYLLPGSPAYDPRLAGRLWPVLRTAFQALDADLGARQAMLPKQAALALVSDHGMGPVRWDFFPNRVLRRAGLLVLDDHQRVDLSRTRAMFALDGGHDVVINSTDHRGGIVRPDQVAEVLTAVEAAFRPLAVKTPSGVVPLVREMLVPTPATMLALGIGGPRGGQLYWDLQPGYGFDGAVTGDDLYRSRPANRSGAAGFDGRREDMQAIFYIMGPAIRPGASLGALGIADWAPTIARYLGAPAPARASGRALDLGR